MSKNQQNCGNCRYAGEFTLTPTGRFRRAAVSRCTFVIQIGPRPECVVDIYEKRMAVRPKDGSTCPAFEVKPSEPYVKIYAVTERPNPKILDPKNLKGGF